MENTELKTDFEKMVKRLAKPGLQIMAQTTPQREDLNHMCLLLAGEVGELIDAIKRFTIYDKKLDMENVIEEFGDIEFALEHLRDILNIAREQTLQHCFNKLSKRYPDKEYSDVHAAERLDKQ